MRLIVEPIHTTAEGDFIEIQELQQHLVAKDDQEREFSLLDENRFYTGLLPRVEEILKAREVDYDLEWTYDNWITSPGDIDFPDTLLPGIELRPHQLSAGMKVIARGGRGVVNIATGGGKTETACAVSKYYIQKFKHDEQILFINDRVKHAHQALRRFQKYGIDCGLLSEGVRDLDHQVISANIASLHTALKHCDRDVMQLMGRIGLLWFDECHHLVSNMWTRTGESCPSAKRVGLSASAFDDPNERYYEDMLLIGQTGDVVCYVPPRWLINRGYLAEPLIHYTPVATQRPRSMDWMTVYREGIVNNNYRNYLIAGYAHILRNFGHKVLILVQRIDHGKNLLKLLRDPSVVFSFGGDQIFRCDEQGELVEESMSSEDMAKMFDSQTSGILIGSTVYDESIDIPTMTALIMAGGGKKFRRTVQRIGRAAHSTNEFVHVFDFWDTQHPYLQKHSRERLNTYNLLEYKAYKGLDEFTNKTGIHVSPQQIVLEYTRRFGTPQNC